MQYRETITGNEPLTLEEVKDYLNVDFDLDDNMILDQISAARNLVEEYTNRSFIEKSITLFDECAQSPYYLPFPNHSSITEVKINGEVTDNYEPQGLVKYIIYFNTFGVITNLYRGAGTAMLEVSYTTSGECPQAVKEAMKKAILDFYDYRGNKYEGTITQLSEGSMMMLQAFVDV